MRKATNNSELILIESIKKGDTSAFRILVEKYKDVSFSLACSILKDEKDTEDALQESFLRVYKNIRKFRNNASFATWLYRIVVNVCYSAASKKSKKQESSDYTNNNIENNYKEIETGYDKLEASERKKIINEVLNKMKSDESLLLRLFYLSELNINEIIEITGFSESKIKVTLHRARKSLHDNLSKVLGNELKLIL